MEIVVEYVFGGTFEVEIEKFSNSFLLLFWFVGTFGNGKSSNLFCRATLKFFAARNLSPAKFESSKMAAEKGAKIAIEIRSILEICKF